MDEVDQLEDVIAILKERCHSFVLGAFTQGSMVVLTTHGLPPLGLGLAHQLANAELERSKELCDRYDFKKSMES